MPASTPIIPNGSYNHIATAYISGSTSASGVLTLQSTSHATKGSIIFGTASAYDELNDKLGIGTTSPAVSLDIIKSQNDFTRIRIYNANAGGSAYSGITIGNDENSSAAGIQLNSIANASYAGAGSLNIAVGTNRAIGFATNGTLRASFEPGGTLFIRNTTALGTTPSGGGYFYVESGALKYKGSSGTVTTIAAA